MLGDEVVASFNFGKNRCAGVLQQAPEFGRLEDDRSSRRTQAETTGERSGLGQADVVTGNIPAGGGDAAAEEQHGAIALGGGVRVQRASGG